MIRRGTDCHPRSAPYTMHGKLWGAQMSERIERTRRRRAFSPWFLLLLIPYPALMWVPFYNSVEPVILGFPFFYAYQIGWVILTAILTAFVYAVTR